MSEYEFSEELIVRDATVARIFFNGQGVEVTRDYKNRDGERRTRKYTFWFNKPVDFAIGTMGTFRGAISYKIDNWTNADGTPKLKDDGTQGQSIVVQGNDSVFEPKFAPTSKPANAEPVDVTPF
jgi:hypothetical protein